MDVGLIPYYETETYRQYHVYEHHKHGCLNPHLFPNLPARGTLGELVAADAGAEAVTRQDALDELDAEDESDEESDEESDDSDEDGEEM